MMRNEEGGISERLESMILSDDKDGFVKLLEANPGEITKSVLEKCAKHGAKECLLALLKGEETGHPPPLLDHQGDSQGVTALAYAAHCCPDPQIIQLMLNKCNAASQLNVYSTIDSFHGSPLHFLLLHVSYQHRLCTWDHGCSLIVLVFYLCLPTTKPILDSIRLLAHSTDSINAIAWTFLNNYGALKQFVALLLVSREKVMAPFDSGLTMHQRLTDEIISLSQADIDSEQFFHRLMLENAQKFLTLFDIVGDDLSSYCSSMHENVEIIPTVFYFCKLFKEKEVCVSARDVCGIFEEIPAWRRWGDEWICGITSDCSNEDWIDFEPSGAIYLAVSSSKIKPTWELNFATKKHNDGFIPWNQRCWKPSFASQVRFMSTQACHARKISKPLEYGKANHSLVQLARMTMKLKKGLRYL